MHLKEYCTAFHYRGGDYVEKVDIFKDIAERTGGDIYLGVVGAVRTGKSHLSSGLWKRW